MRKTSAVRFFVFGTHMVEDRGRYHRRGIVLMKNDVQAIGQVIFFEFYLLGTECIVQPEKR